MTISNRATILGDLKRALESITIANGFQTDVETVLRGIQPEEAFSGRMPGLCLWNERGPRDNLYQGGSERRLVCHIWGYAVVQADIGNYEALDKLVADVEKCLMTESYNGYWGFTDIRETVYYEGGIDDPIGIFDMVVEVSYNYAFASP